jgi:hypothetical protein
LTIVRAKGNNTCTGKRQTWATSSQIAQVTLSGSALERTNVMSHPLVHSSVISWPSYRGTAQLVGASPSGRTTVYVDPSLGQPAEQNAQDLLGDADRIEKFNDSIFGVPGGKVNVIIFALNGATNGTGGADHMACNFVTGQNIEVCASFGQSVRCSALYEAELSECSMRGRLCGLSTGEALSRWCAMMVSNNALADFASAPVWYQHGMPNWVARTDQTDRNDDSIGCGMAFLSWLMVTEGISLAKVAQAMVTLGNNGTLRQLGVEFGSPPRPWREFSAAIQALPGGVTSDDPFGAMAAAAKSVQARRT